VYYVLHTGCARDPDLHKQKYCTPNFLRFFGFAKTIQLLITQKIKAQAQNHTKGMMLPSKIECFTNDNKKVFHLQICDSLQIQKGHNPWHTL
jgi:hypothetical protein